MQEPMPVPDSFSSECTSEVKGSRLYGVTSGRSTMGISKENLDVEKMAKTKQCEKTRSAEFSECALVELMRRIDLGETLPNIASAKSWEQKASSQLNQNGVDSQSRVPYDGQDNYVELEAPSADDVEENEAALSSKDAGSETQLEERGPMYGVPAPAGAQVDPHCIYIASKVCKPYQIQNDFLMGAGDGMMSPEVMYTNSVGLNAGYSKGPKRGRDDRGMDQIPKYIKPQVAIPVETGSFTFPSCNASSGNSKAHCQVLQTQMSGGTMYTPQDPDKDTLDSGEIQELFFPATINPNFTFNIEDILSSSGPPPSHKTSSDFMDPALSTFDCQQWSSNPGLFTCYPPTSSQLPMGQSQFLPARQQFQPDRFSGKRNSLGADDGSDGYGSGGDLSPPHESQSSPVPSPYSVMESSPVGFNGSPPRVDWSPPPTNLSNSSMDSGFCSPRAEDMGGNTSTSPYHVPEMSPPHVSSNFVNPPQMKSGCVAPQSLVSSDWMPTFSALPQQNGSSQLQHKHRTSQVFQTDQDTENKDTENKWVSEHILDLDIALQIAGEDLIKEQLMKQRKKIVQPNKQRLSDISARTDNCSAVDTVRMPASQSANQPIPVSTGLPPTTPRNLPTYEAATFPSTGATNFPPYVAANLKTTSVTNLPTYSLQTSSVTNLPTYIATSLQTSSVTNLPTYIATSLQTSSVTNLPTFVTSTRDVAVCQPFTSKQVSCPVVDPTKTVNNKDSPVPGKVLIERLNPKPKAIPCSTKTVPVIVTTCVGKTTPVLIVPPIFSEPRTTQSRRLPDIAPKEPTKPVASGDKMTSQTNNASNGNSVQACMSRHRQPDEMVKVQMPKEKKLHGNSKERLLNLARRLVAEMSTADLKYVDEDGDTYLHVAVCRADKFMVQALLERLVRENLREMIDKQNFEGQTPLYLAVSTNNAEMVQLLIEQGADVTPFAESSSPAGHTEKTTAIHCASSKGDKYLETLKALLTARGINLNLVNSYGHTALICAILAHGRRNTDTSIVNSIPIMQALVKAGAKLNLQAQHSGKTALMYALESRDLALIESIFHLVEPHMLASFLKTQAFDGSTCLRIAESIKATLSPADQKRLCQCLKPSLAHSRGSFTS